jgi:non-ribosomal peptide synthase protein (TIGR01720 family)
VTRWRQRRGDPAGPVLVDVESHGRHSDDLDLSRTVGWFTSVHPVRLDLGDIPAGEVAAGGEAAGAAVKRVKQQLRAVPGDGLGYGLLRYLNPDTCGALAALPAPQIGFNYLGRFLTGTPARAANKGVAPPRYWQPAREPAGTGAHPGASADSLAAPAPHPLEAAAMVREDLRGGPRLVLVLFSPHGLISQPAIGRLGRDWEAAVRGLIGYANGA